MNLNDEDNVWSWSLQCQKPSLRSAYLNRSKFLCKLSEKIRAISRHLGSQFQNFRVAETNRRVSDCQKWAPDSVSCPKARIMRFRAGTAAGSSANVTYVTIIYVVSVRRYWYSNNSLPRNPELLKILVRRLIN
jgi:hypothetical protein